MKTLATILSTLLLASCVATAPSVKLPGAITVTVEEKPELLKPRELERATIFYKNGVPHTCHVILRKYPKCLQHGIRHCLEGDWHAGQKYNDQDCD